MTIFRRRHFVTFIVIASQQVPHSTFKSLHFNHSRALRAGTWSLARLVHLYRSWRRKGQDTLKISINEQAQDTQIKLDGRIAGPWTAELRRVWMETASRIAGKRLVIDLREVTYADASATKLLREIYEKAHAQVIAGSVWTQSLAEYISQSETLTRGEEK